jgi:hypothetical protein
LRQHSADASCSRPFEDAVHFNAAGAEIQGVQAAMTIKGLLQN